MAEEFQFQFQQRVHNRDVYAASSVVAVKRVITISCPPGGSELVCRHLLGAGAGAEILELTALECLSSR